MRDSDNIWEEKFNDNSLNDESWLEPSQDIFDNISAEIYGKEEKRRSYLIFFFLIFGLLLSVTLLLVPTKESPIDNTKIIPTTSDVQQHSMILGNDKERAFELKKDPVLKNTQLIVNSSEEVFVFESVTKSNGNSNSVKKNLEKVIDSEPRKQIKFSEKVSVDKPATSNTSNTDQLTEKVIVSYSDSTDSILESSSSSSSSLNGRFQNEHTFEVSTLNKIPLIKPNLLVSSYHKDLFAPTLVEFITPERIIAAQAYVSFGVNYEYWNFSLNNNYSTALNPADFSHSSGKGASINIIVGKTLFEKLDIVGGISIQKIKFESGHNSSIEYLRNQEFDGDKSNMFNLTMASPIGFLESDLVVQRSNELPTLNTDLIVDLHNEHNITNLDVHIGLDYNLIESNKMSFILGFRTGINKFLNINNTLSSFDLDNSNFTSGATDIVKDQSSVNSLTGYIGSSIKIEYKVNENFSLGTNVGYSMNLAPIYQENDFSTQLQSIQSGVYLRKNF